LQKGLKSFWLPQGIESLGAFAESGRQNSAILGENCTLRFYAFVANSGADHIAYIFKVYLLDLFSASAPVCESNTRIIRSLHVVTNLLKKFGGKK
jgi:hypothetical protein